MSEPYECRESSTICHRGPLKHVVMSTIRIARSIHCSQLPEWQLEVSSDLARPGYLGRQTRLGIPPQVRAGSRKVRTDLALKFATAASIDQILFSIVVVSASSRVCCFVFLFWRFRVSSAWCLASHRVGFLEDYVRAARA